MRTVRVVDVASDTPNYIPTCTRKGANLCYDSSTPKWDADLLPNVGYKSLHPRWSISQCTLRGADIIMLQKQHP